MNGSQSFTCWRMNLLLGNGGRGNDQAGDDRPGRQGKNAAACHGDLSIIGLTVIRDPSSSKGSQSGTINREGGLMRNHAVVVKTQVPSALSSIIMETPRQ